MFLHADNLICDHFLLVSLSAIDEKELCSLLRSEQCDRALMYVLIDNTTLIPFNGGKLVISSMTCSTWLAQECACDYSLLMRSQEHQGPKVQDREMGQSGSRNVSCQSVQGSG